MIDVKNLNKSFGELNVLKDITEHIYPGEKVVNEETVAVSISKTPPNFLSIAKRFLTSAIIASVRLVEPAKNESSPLYSA